MSAGPRVAVVGLGYWGPNLVRNLVALIGADRVVAVDESLDRVAAVSAQHALRSCYLSLDQALRDDSIGAVVVATPVSTHAPLARAALEAGRAVLVEKPLAASSTEALELLELASREQVTLMVGHTFLFSPRVERIAQHLRDGRLGGIQYATSSRLNLGLHQRDIGVIWDLAPHDFSILFHLLQEFPVSVQTSGRAVVRPGVLDVAFMNLRFASGIVGSVSVSWLAPKKVRNTVLVGDEQMLVYDDLDSDEPVKIYDRGVEWHGPQNFGEHQLTYRHGDVLVPHVPPHEPLNQELRHFLDCVEHGVQCRSDGWFGVRVVEVLEAAEESWRRDGEPAPIAPRLEPPRLSLSGTIVEGAAEAAAGVELAL